MGARANCILFVLFIFAFLSDAPRVTGQEIRAEGWPVPDLTNLLPYSITIQTVDGVEKMVEKFLTVTGGHVARISGNGRVYAYAIDHDQEPPIDFLILDPDGSQRFLYKYGPEDSFHIPEWVSY